MKRMNVQFSINWKKKKNFFPLFFYFLPRNKNYLKTVFRESMRNFLFWFPVSVSILDLTRAFASSWLTGVDILNANIPGSNWIKGSFSHFYRPEFFKLVYLLWSSGKDFFSPFFPRPRLINLLAVILRAARCVSRRQPPSKIILAAQR